MKQFIVISAICLLLLNTAKAVNTEDDDNLEYEDTAAESDEKPPIYDLKDAPKLFEKFIKDFHKDYKDKPERDSHYKNFVSNLKYINEINGEGRSSSADINMFADLNDDEIALL